MTHVLVVDDDRSIRDLVGLNLISSGYEVSMASDGAAALDLIRAQHPDVVLLDIMMPVVDGRTVAATVRADPELCDVAIVYLTACASDPDVWAGWRTGADSYLCKPFDPLRLVDEVDRVVRARRATGEPSPHGHRIAIPDVDPSGFAAWFVGEERIRAHPRRTLAGASL